MEQPNQESSPESFTLTVLLQHAGKLLDDQLRAGFESFGLYPSQGRVLHVLGNRDGYEQQELASAMKVSAPTVSGILKRMEAEGLIARYPDPNDERVSRVSLTRKGRQKCRLVGRVVKEVERTLVAGFSRAQLRAAHSSLRQLRNNLGGGPPGPEPSVEAVIP